MRSIASELSLRRKAESMSEQVVFRRQFLSVLVKRHSGSPDSISDFGRLLLLESNLLAQVFRAFLLLPVFRLMSSTSISLFVSEHWLLGIFVFTG